MNIQLIESLVETIHTLSQEERIILWQKLDYEPTTESILLQKVALTLPLIIQHRSGVKNIRRLLVMADLHPPN
jgi:hypothetical protein